MLSDNSPEHDRDRGLADHAESIWAGEHWHEPVITEPRPRVDYTGWLVNGPESTHESVTTDDDPETDHGQPDSPIRSRRGRPRTGRVWPVAGGLMTATVLVGLVVLVESGFTHRAHTPATGTTRAAAVTSSPLPECVSIRSPQRVSGNGPGSTTTGPDAVLALEYAYYVRRSAPAVRALLAPNGPFGSDGQIQSGISGVPPGTTHCVDITGTGPDRWSVTITEHRPAGSTAVLHQTITTSSHDGRTVIAAVEPT